jgi:hypothetical protein
MGRDTRNAYEQLLPIVHLASTIIGSIPDSALCQIWVETHIGTEVAGDLQPGLMFPDEAIAVIALTIRAEVAHRLGSLRLLPEAEEELAIAMLNALEEAGFDVVRREATDD